MGGLALNRSLSEKLGLQKVAVLLPLDKETTADLHEDLVLSPTPPHHTTCNPEADGS